MPGTGMAKSVLSILLGYKALQRGWEPLSWDLQMEGTVG